MIVAETLVRVGVGVRVRVRVSQVKVGDVTWSRSGVIVAETSIVCTDGGSASPMAAMSSPGQGEGEG